jgi:hypothetical protein
VHVRNTIFALVPIVLVLSGCGGAKLSASQTAVALYRQSGHHHGDGYIVRCAKGTYGDDYLCTFFQNGEKVGGSRRNPRERS